jgi:hypothetical protein
MAAPLGAGLRDGRLRWQALARRARPERADGCEPGPRVNRPRGSRGGDSSPLSPGSGALRATRFPNDSARTSPHAITRQATPATIRGRGPTPRGLGCVRRHFRPRRRLRPRPPPHRRAGHRRAYPPVHARLDCYAPHGPAGQRLALEAWSCGLSNRRVPRSGAPSWGGDPNLDHRRQPSRVAYQSPGACSGGSGERGRGLGSRARVEGEGAVATAPQPVAVSLPSLADTVPDRIRAGPAAWRTPALLPEPADRDPTLERAESAGGGWRNGRIRAGACPRNPNCVSGSRGSDAADVGSGRWRPRKKRHGRGRR